ncbi:leucine-rich repeat extensin-like protein 3 isoform X2 [Magnolia sinica]|uniref:leucine-rich repeat extensin-like protein 3 isoform X2 n=1 Tax=Magnolia sinica TaxID=86752 RepID=UPI0026599CA6|nr:leucine-rich repeat extensin-like protein 3 isoform X2 [Magnolia sinica]
MVPDQLEPRIMEIQVRMDCNGCVQKIKKALHGIKGIYDVYIDLPQQKLTIVGWADPEMIIKAIKKTRKIATICVHTEASEPQPQTPPAPAESNPPAPDATNPPPIEPLPSEQTPPAEPAKEPSPPENPPQEATPSTAPTDTAPRQPVGPSEPKDVEAVHIIHHHPHDYGYGGPWNTYPSSHVYRQETPQYVTHSYNNYRPSPHISAYVSDHGYPQSPPQNIHYSRTEHYVDEYQGRSNGDGNNITSIFSDENPNACIIA